MTNEIKWTKEDENLEIIIETSRELSLITSQDVLNRNLIPIGEPALAVKPQGGEEFWPKYTSFRHIIHMNILNESIPEGAIALTIGRLSRDRYRDLGKEFPAPLEPVYLPVQFYALGGK